MTASLHLVCKAAMHLRYAASVTHHLRKIRQQEPHEIARPISFSNITNLFHQLPK